MDSRLSHDFESASGDIEFDEITAVRYGALLYKYTNNGDGTYTKPSGVVIGSKACDLCKKEPGLCTDGKKCILLKCASCCSRYYCSRECQKLDWRYHKRMCKQLAMFKRLNMGLRYGAGFPESLDI